MARKDTEADNRPFFKALVYTREGDLDLGWLLLLVFSIIAAASVLFTVIIAPASIPVQIASLSLLGSVFMAVLIAAIPIAKAKILANSKLPSEVAKSIASVSNVETSTDVQELYMKTQPNVNDDIG